MKRILCFLFLFACGYAHAAITPQFCNDVQNTWIVSNSVQQGAGNQSWILAQSSSGLITGQINNYWDNTNLVYVQLFVTSGGQYPISEYKGNGVFYIHAETNPQSNNKIDTNLTIALDPSVNGGCTQATLSSGYLPPTTYATYAWVPPSYSASQWAGWSLSSPNGIGVFNTGLAPPTGMSWYSYAGRVVTATYSGAGTACNPVGVTLLPFATVYLDTSSGTPYGESSDGVIQDALGWYNPSNVNQIRQNDITPCATPYYEQWYINGPNGTTYPIAGAHINTYQINEPASPDILFTVNSISSPSPHVYGSTFQVPSLMWKFFCAVYVNTKGCY